MRKRMVIILGASSRLGQNIHNYFKKNENDELIGKRQIIRLVRLKRRC